ncbi:phospholipid-translocating P-type ATPase [Tricholoma matsutake]|nr:phospholipid-translocating P-type ATPase [Tricholoma matsutake 945]
MSNLVVWYNKLAAFNVEDLFVRKREPGPRRTVYVNQNLPDDYRDEKGRVKPQHVYTSNQVITSKYTILTFLPRNLLEQFRRIANLFFLGIAILQFFHKFSTISPGLVIFPLLVVLAITALKDGYEDVKRHQSDRRVNYSTVRVLSGAGWVNPNSMQKKSRTFVRAIVPTSKKPKKVRSPPIETETDTPESLDVLAEDAEVEYDDLHEEGIDTTLHLFGHHGDDERPHWKKTIWENVRVGDFVKIKENESFPADILICATSEDENVAYVETKNLDGETNLKSRNAAPALTHLRTARDCANIKNGFRMECDRPNVNMYKLNASLIIDRLDKGDTVVEKEGAPAVFPIDMQMMLLRGTILRNTGWVIGVVMYTGEDTRIVMNSGGTPSKRSKVERQMNPQVFINLIILACMAVACAIVDAVLEHRYYPRNAPWLYDDNRSDDNPSINGLITWAFALITFQNIVPISLYISIEFVRTCQAAFIYFDGEIYYDKLDQPTLARSWNLADDLGQIEYIFSDKTGTLTQNSMIFRECSIGGKVYSGDSEEAISDVLPLKDPDIKLVDRSSSGSASGSSTRGPSRERPLTAPSDSNDSSPTPAHLKVQYRFHDTTLTEDLQSAVYANRDSEDAPHARSLNGFFTVLGLCHTVLASTDRATGAIEYKAQSPDEAALVHAAADVGYVFKGREPGDVLVLQTPFGEERYELLDVLEFTSARKRMSVVVRRVGGGDEKGEGEVEGGDRRLFLLCKGADTVVFERLKQGVGAEALRETTERHLSEFASRGLRTLTLAYKVIPEDEYAVWSERYRAATLKALANEKDKSLLLRLATMCEGVICCRVSPIQKALVVNLVKDGLGAMTLAIGDGANDVSMIQAADVGVGISGEEGLQAVNSSDYAIAQFRFLKRLLFVHGHWSYARNGNMINNFFYKNIVCIGVLWWFQIYAAWSAPYVFEYTYLLFWNSFWTIAPVIAIGIFDRIVDAEVLMALPELYNFGRKGHWFGLKWFAIYMLDAVVQSAIIFFLIFYTYKSISARTDGYDVSQYEFATTMVLSAVIVANLFNGLNTNVWTWWVFFAVSIGIILLLLFTAVYNAISPGWFVTTVWGNNHFLWPSAYFWLCLPLTICLALAPRYLAKAWKFGFAPDDIDIMRYIAKMEPDRDVVRDAQLGGALKSMAAASSLSRTDSIASATYVRPSVDVRHASRTDMSTGERVVNRGFDFSTEEQGVAMRRIQTNLSERRESSRNLTLQDQPKNSKLGHVFSVRKTFLRRKLSDE